MLDALRAGIAEHGIANIEPIEARWPPPDVASYAADVGLMAHVGYDIEAIGPFVEAFEDASARLCVAVLLERPPASLVARFWPAVHGEDRIALPALPDLVALLEARGAAPEVDRIALGRRSFDAREEVAAFVRRQLWVAPGGEKDRLAMALLDEWLEPGDDGSVGLAGAAPLEVGVVTWHAPPERGSTQS
jgi:hypothetical protein